MIKIFFYFFLLKIVFLVSFCLKAEKYILESSSNVLSEHIEVTKSLKSTTVSIENRWTAHLVTMAPENVMVIF